MLSAQVNSNISDVCSSLHWHSCSKKYREIHYHSKGNRRLWLSIFLGAQASESLVDRNIQNITTKVTSKSINSSSGKKTTQIFQILNGVVIWCTFFHLKFLCCCCYFSNCSMIVPKREKETK